MGASAQTAALLLPQFSDNDKPTWRGDVNDAFAKVDTGHASVVARLNTLDAEHTSDLNQINANTLAITNLQSGKVDKTAVEWNVKLHGGAVGDGVADDRAAIQSVLDMAGPNGYVYFPAGNYRLGSMSMAGDRVLKFYAGQRIRGAGRDQSIVKIGNNLGDYYCIFGLQTAGTYSGNAGFSEFTIDQNDTGNPATNAALTTGGKPRIPIYGVSYNPGDVFTVFRTRFHDCNNINTLYLGSEIVMITHSMFTKTGSSTIASVGGPARHDHSSIYATVTMNGGASVIANNTFSGVLGGVGATTAIETHGGMQNVHGNTVRAYYCGANITGVNSTTDSNVGVITGNTFKDVNIGIDLWSYANSPLHDFTVSHNNMLLERDAWISTASDYPRGIMLDTGATGNIETLRIQNNIIEFKAFAAAALTGELQAAGISVWINATTTQVNDLSVLDNSIKNSLSAGIRLQATTNRGKIARNKIINPGSSTDAGMASYYKGGISVAGTLTDLTVENNDIYDTRAAHVIAAGVQTLATAPTTNCVVRRNNTQASDGVTIPSFLPSSAANVAFYMDEEMNVYAAPFYPVKVGSKIFDRATGNTWVQTTAPTGTTWAQRAL